MSSLQEILNDIPNNSPYISKSSVTLINQNIISFEVNHIYANIICLHLSKNQIQTLDGISNFPNLKYFSISFNFIATPKEFIKCSEQITNLSVQGNPFCLNPDYENILIDQFPNLVALDFLQITPQKREQARIVRAKMESFGFLLLVVIQMLSQSDIPSTLYQLSLKIHQIMQSNRNYFKKLSELLEILDETLKLNEHAFIDQALEIYHQTQNTLAEILFEKTSTFMQEFFQDRTLKQFFAHQALQSLQISQLVEDTNNLTQMMIQEFAPSKGGFLQFPTFIYNQRYMLGVMHIHVEVNQEEEPKQIDRFKQSSDNDTENRQKTPVKTLPNRDVKNMPRQITPPRAQKNKEDEKIENLPKQSSPPRLILSREYGNLNDFIQTIIDRNRKVYKLIRVLERLDEKYQKQIRQNTFQYLLERHGLVTKRRQDSLRCMVQTLLFISLKNQRFGILGLRVKALETTLNKIDSKYSQIKYFCSIKRKNEMINDKIDKMQMKTKKRLRQKVFKSWKNRRVLKSKALQFRLLNLRLKAIKREAFKNMLMIIAIQNFNRKPQKQNQVLLSQPISQTRSFMNSKVMEKIFKQRGQSTDIKKTDFFYGRPGNQGCGVCGWDG